MTIRGWSRTALVATIIGIAGCSPERPAQMAIAAADSALAAAPSETQAYLGAAHQEVVDQIGAARAALEAKDYQTAVTQATEATTAIGGFPAAIEAKKTELTQTWTAMGESVPGMLAAIGNRVTELRKARRLPAGVTKESLTAAGATIDSSKAAWAAAAEAFQGGNLPEAVRMGSAVKVRAAETMRSLGMEM